VAVVEHALGDLVLALRRDPLVVAPEHQEVVVRGRRGPPVGEIVRDEPDHAVLADVDLRGEELRIDHRERARGELVAEIVRRELPDVADAGESLDQDRIAQLHLLERADDDVLHGDLPCRRLAGCRR